MAAERFPPPDFETQYEMPPFVQTPPDVNTEGLIAAGLLVLALSAAAFIVHRWRSRKAMIVLSMLSLVYFGFVRKGCVCPVGATQHVALSLFDSTYAIPFTVAFFFALPLVYALLFGRVFCAGVCPLGAIQDVLLIKPLRLPRWLTEALSIGPFVYLGLAVVYVVTGAGFIICRYDPFVAFFRRSGTMPMLIGGGVLLAVSVFVGRPYCRFACPYSVLLRLCSRWSWRKVSTTPDECVVCSLCENSCPFDAIEPPTPQGVEET